MDTQKGKTNPSIDEKDILNEDKLKTSFECYMPIHVSFL